MFCISNFWELFLPVIFVNNNMLSDRDLALSSYHTHNLFNSTLPLHKLPEVFAPNSRTVFLMNSFSNIYFTQICLTDEFYKIISNVNNCFNLFYYSDCLNLFRYFALFTADLLFSELCGFII